MNINDEEGQSTGSTNGIIADLSSSSNFSLTRTGDTGNYKNVNLSGEKHVAYCWTEIPGYSKFGTYKGTGNSNGARVHLGFRPAWIMTKRSSSARNWLIFDVKRDADNVATEFLEADTSIAEATINGGLDFLSDGFKIVTSDTDINGADTSGGDTYIYMAFAEQPGITSFDTFPNAR